MNFAMICDVVGGGMKSYYIKDKKGYDFNDKPYDFNVSIGNAVSLLFVSDGHLRGILGIRLNRLTPFGNKYVCSN